MTESSLKNTTPEGGCCFKNIMPDSVTGMVFAAEGIKNAVVLLNGPMGCKFYHSTTSQYLTVRPIMYLPSEEGEKVPVDYNCLNSYFFRQPRVPSTYLDGYDYVYGTADKVKDALIFLRDSVDFELLVIINSPGASLIGDHLKDLSGEIMPDKPCAVLESPGFSGDLDEGYEEAALEILKQAGLRKREDLCRAQSSFPEGEPAQESFSGDRKDKAGNGSPLMKKEKRDFQEKKNISGTGKKVNLLGLSIWDRYNDGDKKELCRMLGLCGIEVNCILCSGSSLEDIRNIPAADLNVAVNPRAGRRCALYLKENYGMDYYAPCGLPIGFKETEEFIMEICRRLNADPSALIKESEEARGMAWYKINEFSQNSGLPDGALFAAEGSCGQVYSYSRFFMDYLGMIPDVLSVTQKGDLNQEKELKELLLKFGAQEALKKDIRDTKAELVFADANTIAMLKAEGKVFSGIEISFPGMGYTDLVPKTHLGINGALFLTEQVLNGFMSRL